VRLGLRGAPCRFVLGCWPGWCGCELPPPGLVPAFFGLGVGMTLLLGFGLPPVLQLARVPPMRVIRRDLGAAQAGSLLAVLAAGSQSALRCC
jgi:putative ABC transport system permease protein